MQALELSQSQIEDLRRPRNWDDLERESVLVTHEKIRRAQELGVVAVLYTGDQVNARIRELAILEHALRNGDVDRTVYATIMRGGVPFSAKLLTEIACLSPSMNPIADYIEASRFGDKQVGEDKLEIIRTFNPKTDINGKRLVKIDDTIDEGVTMQLLGRAATDPDECRQLGPGITGPAAELGIITLTDKGIARIDGYDPNSILRGLWIPNVWAGGNGLDGPNEAMRWIPEIVVTRVQHEKYRETLPEVLDALGERAMLGMKDIKWTSE